MVFSSLTFLYIFLPLVIFLNFILQKKFRNALLLVASILFYSWGGVSYTSLLIISIVFNFVIGKLISNNLGNPKSRLYLTLGVIINLGFLGVFKYGNFIVQNINVLFENTGISFSISNPGILLPIGISFYTFQALSYLIDVYRRRTPVQNKFVDLALYISLFPQLIAGPIVRYNDIAEQLSVRENNRANFVSGIERFVIGLAKKVLIANQFALLADTAFSMAPENLSTFIAWAGVVAYSFQIYFDFSGYSDMAIGLGRMFGFKFLENFNFPYIAKSIREFWRRWHISLSNWFRDYLYIPLGGNRKGNYRTYFNLLIVFFVTGIWHGASWNFVAWGMLHGLFMVIEKLGFNRLLTKLWRPFQHIYTLFIVMMAWVLFRADDFTHTWGYFEAMFSYKSTNLNIDILHTFLNNEIYLVLVIAILSSTRIWVIIYNNALAMVSKNNSYLNIANGVWSFIVLIFVVGVMILSTNYLVVSSYNPFIYFRF
ncbi:MAG: membrane-bound O-acyltransferase family protein [Bacteroidetes bacterium]|nr:membrane-bound O-acyltransferase family protein [Bacteroidota bacterium]|tara:strand:+ start:473 stop:1924 length:1452 start_codon:yes stop_codon:yes gene_type:complete